MLFIADFLHALRNATLIFILIFITGCVSTKSEDKLGQEEQATSESVVSNRYEITLRTSTTNSKLPILDGPVIQTGQDAYNGPISRRPDFVESKPVKAPIEVPVHVESIPSGGDAKPWNIRLKAGSDLAVIDGVLVYLSQPAKAIDSKGGKCKPAPIDERTIFAPLKTAHTNAIAPMRPLRIFIDPGHGGDDPGAHSKNATLIESKLVLDISKRLAKHLSNAGFEVALSRSDSSTNLRLDERTTKAARWKADVFLSIHINASTGSGAHCLETYVLPAKEQPSTAASNSSATFVNNTEQLPGNTNNVRNMQLGFAIQRRLLKTTGFDDRGLRRARFAVLREASMPAALVECGFISSKKDQKLIETPNGRERIALGIYQGLCDYAYGTMSPGLPPHPVKENTK